MGRVSLRKFSQGLVLTPSPDETPLGALRRARGIHPEKTLSVRSRNGCSLLQSLAAEAIVRFADTWYYKVGSVLYRTTTSIRTGLSGFLFFMKAPPNSGITDYLFCSGGGSLFKVTSAGAVSNWGIAPPLTNPTAAKGTAKYRTIDTMEIVGGVTPQTRWGDGTAVITVDTTRKVEGSQSMVIGSTGASTTLTAQYNYYTRNTAELNLSTFSDGTALSDFDYVQFWLYIDAPENINYIQLDFSLLTELFNDTYTVSMVPTDIPSDAVGLGTVQQFTYTEKTGKVIMHQTKFGVEEINTIVYVTNTLDAVGVPKTAKTWVKIRIGQQTFDRHGAGTATWANVRAIKFTIQTNTGGACDVRVDDFKLYGGFGVQGRYRYKVTFMNTVTGTRSNAYLPSASVGGKDYAEIIGVIREGMALTSVPISTDPQVNRREIWRTNGDGELYFLCGTIDNNTTTTFTDTVADVGMMDNRATAVVLSDTELPTDNIVPYAHFTDCMYHNASVFWISAAASHRGRVYYSPIGRTEAMEGFIDVTNDDAPLQRLFRWSDALYVIGEGGIWKINGTNPYTAQRIYGCPGTTYLYHRTLVTTPRGVVYQAQDGVRLFNGMSADRIDGAVSLLFNGEASEGLSTFRLPFLSPAAAYCRGEYFISQGLQTLVVNLHDGSWREIGLPFSAFHYADDVDILAGTAFLTPTPVVYIVENSGIVNDAGVGIPFSVEPAHVRLSDKEDALLRTIHIDINTGGQIVTATLILDGTEMPLGSFSNTVRDTITIHVHYLGRVVGVRLTAAAAARITVYGIDLDVYQTGEE